MSIKYIFDKNKKFKDIWNDATATVRNEILYQAIELGLFEKMAQPITSKQLSETVSIPQKLIDLVLMILWSMNFVDKKYDAKEDIDYYVLHEKWAPYFLKSSSLYFGDAIKNRIAALQSYQSELKELFSQYKPDAETPKYDWNNAGKTHLFQDQEVITGDLAVHFIDQYYKKDEVCKFLDIGGNPGITSMKILEYFEKFKAYIFDIPDTKDNIKKTIKKYNNLKINALFGFFPKDPIGSGYDFIWCSQVLYFIDDINLAIKSLKQSLKKGGLLFMAHAELPIENRDVMGTLLSWYNGMYRKNMHIYPENTMANLLEREGFSILDNSFIADFQVCPLKMIIGKKII